MSTDVAYILALGFMGGCAMIAWAICLAIKALLAHNWRFIHGGDTRHIHMTKEEFDKLTAGGAQ